MVDGVVHYQEAVVDIFDRHYIDRSILGVMFLQIKLQVFGQTPGSDFRRHAL